MIKGKDPQQILADLRRLDHMEFSVDQPSPLNDKVLGDKRRKLKETWDRMMHLYQKEDKDKFVQLKRLQEEYEAERNDLKKHFEAVKSAENVHLDEIPLPALPSSLPHHVSSLTTYRTVTLKQPPGPPPGPPPRLSEFDGLDEAASDSKRPVAADKEVDEFLKEIADFVPPTVSQPLSLPMTAVPPPTVIRNPLLLLQPQTPVQPPLGTRPMSFASFPRNRQPQTTVSQSQDRQASQAATIEAKPQLRNLSADATRFTPLSLRIKRSEKAPVTRPAARGSGHSEATGQDGSGGTQSKEAAYEQFMRELQGLL